jgi:hypothetical protein
MTVPAAKHPLTENGAERDPREARAGLLDSVEKHSFGGAKKVFRRSIRVRPNRSFLNFFVYPFTS